jgi:hypothetical protein
MLRFMVSAMTPQQEGSILATLAISVHKTPPPADAVSLRDYMDGSLRLPSSIPERIATGILS